MERLASIVYGSKPSTIAAEYSILDVCGNPEYAADRSPISDELF